MNYGTRLTEITTPTLVLAGAADLSTPPERTQDVRRRDRQRAHYDREERRSLPECRDIRSVQFGVDRLPRQIARLNCLKLE